MTSSSSNPSDGTLPMATILHMISIKLHSNNYLLWRNQMIPLLLYQKLMSHVDGSAASPSTMIIADNKELPNPAYTAWFKIDQRAVILLNSSFSEEAAAEVIGLSYSAQIWDALKNAYSHSSVERMHSLRDQLRLLGKETSYVSDFGRKFKALCDQLSTIGQPVDESDMLHWFLCGLGASFETFSTAIRASKPHPSFRDLVSQAESHELFLTSPHGSTSTSPVAFVTDHSRPSYTSRGRGQSSRGGGHGRGRRTPYCQLCRTDGHYASHCPKLASYATKAASLDANLANAFHAQCDLSDTTPDWYVTDSGASTHMTSSPDILPNAYPHIGNQTVTFGNGQTLNVSHTGSNLFSNNIMLNDVLVVPHLTKNLLSISKLTSDNHVDVLFSQPYFTI
ncbi:putative RNA-directed DNA polymerase [Tanacetum coccineum]|uniref:RNA-directed DNA polymerase n=1 Tax=Tanacetum coccineum TaxID=301880 RepID=A0ABQ5DEN2_9ASTR